MKKLLVLTAALLLCFCLSGCVREHFTDAQQEERAEAGRRILEEYLSTLPERCEIISCRMISAAEANEPVYGSKYLSNYVYARFRTGDKIAQAVIGLTDGLILTDYGGVFDPNKALERQLAPYCDRYGFTGSIKVSGAEFAYTLVSHDIDGGRGKTLDTCVYENGLIPAELSSDHFSDSLSWEDAVLRNASLSSFSICYEPEDNSFFDPRILLDYLNESGNYMKNFAYSFMRQPDYTIDGRLSSVNGEAPQPIGCSVSFYPAETPDQMTFTVYRTDHCEVRGFHFEYTGGIRQGVASAYEESSFTEYPCPFSLEGNTLHFRKAELGDAALYFTELPSYTHFTATDYTYRNMGESTDAHNHFDDWQLVASEPVELELYQRSDGNYYLRDKNTQRGFDFSCPETLIEFR